MDDNARPYIPRIVRELRQQETFDAFQWPSMNTIEHVVDFIGRKVNQRNP